MNCIFLPVLSYYRLIKVFRTHPVEHEIIAHFQKKCRAGASMGEGSIMGSFGGALAFVFNLVRLKVAEHSFQVLMLWRQFLQESRLTTEVFILA